MLLITAFKESPTISSVSAMRIFLLFILLSHFKHCLVKNTKWSHSLLYHAMYFLGLQLMFTYLGTTFPSFIFSLAEHWLCPAAWHAGAS